MFVTDVSQDACHDLIATDLLELLHPSLAQGRLEAIFRPDGRLQYAPDPQHRPIRPILAVSEGQSKEWRLCQLVI